jgi:polyisoprenoid-binding protein YceI
MSTTAKTTTVNSQAAAAPPISDGAWRLDPARSSVAFHVRHFYGLMTVKGEFADYEGTLDLSAMPAVELTIRADSLNTKLAKRDEHLRSEDFFDVERHPQVRFISDRASLDDETLRVRGQLHAAGRQIPLELGATVREIDGELAIEAVTEADHRELGMTWSPLGILRAPSRLIVRGRLVRR